jgi:hypothetical protein
MNYKIPFKRILELVALIIMSCMFLFTCKDSDNGNETDIYEGLRNTGPGEIKCNGDSCCLTDCWGDEDFECMTRIPDVIVAATLNKPNDGCNAYIFPEWFYAYDCFVVTEGVHGDNGTPYGDDIVHYRGDGTLFMSIRCFCGRGYTSYSSSVKGNLIMAYFPETCHVEYNNPPSYELSEGIRSSWEGCANPCQTCTPRCTGRECGPDGCGGSCGTCGSGETCNAAGQCVYSGTGNTCSECLATCRGLPGCCTGCGCLCEYECGMCW